MIGYAWKINLKFFPELERFKSQADAEKCLGQAYRHNYRSRRLWLYSALIVPVAGVSLPVTLNWAIRSPSVGNIIIVAICFLFGSMAGILPLLLIRNAVRWSLWRELEAAGFPCCLNCGYDLTGNVSGVCPECGTKIESP